MIKLFIPLTLITLCILSDIYIYIRYIPTTSQWRWLWWAPTAVVIGFLIKFLFFNNGLAQEYSTTNIFLLIMGLVCIPKILFSLLSLIPKVGTCLGAVCAAGIVFIILYGITIGFSRLNVRYVTYESPDVPPAFNGYRIAQFSDVHAGSFYGPYEHLLKEGVDSINALKPDLVCFVGDIENFTPTELERHKGALSSIKARDGVMSIMGNHDYSQYIKVSPSERTAMIQRTKDMQRSFGWTLLENDSRTIYRTHTDADGTTHTDSIAIAGEENWGLPPFPQYGNLSKALKGTGSAFLIMLSHDPNAWEHHILPTASPAITLSGHTHGSQFSLFGWSPVSMIYKQWGGTYHNAKGSMLSVSTGFGGNFPFRFNMPREIVVITLKVGSINYHRNNDKN